MENFTAHLVAFASPALLIVVVVAAFRFLRRRRNQVSSRHLRGRALRTAQQVEEALADTSPTQGIRWSSQVHLGLAVSLEAGLVVPVIRAAETLTLSELSARSKELAGKARAGTLTPDEMAGSTFTISNLGMLDVENFTAIINPGEAAILAVASILQKPAVRDGQVVVRSLMKVTLSADHRLIDGALAARFVNAVKQKLEDLESWKRLTS